MAGVTEQCPWCGHAISRAKFDEIQAKIREDEQKKLEAAKQTLREQLEAKHRLALANEKRAAEKRANDEAAKKITAITAERDRNAQKVKELSVREAEIKKQAQDAAELRVRQEVVRQRQILEKDRDQSLLKKQAEFTRERERYQKKIKEMERQLQRKTANEMGDGAEIDLFEALRDAFTTDKITRVPKGQAGADILHEVLYKGQVCGRIIIDSKNRQGWQDGFITKLRADQIAAKADHAILSASVFRSGQKELFVEDGIIVVSPARVVHIIELLRAALLRMHTLGLSAKERSNKMTELYKLLTSPDHKQKFAELGRLADDLSELDVEEAKEHQRVWKKRGSAVTRVKNILRQIDTDVSAIIEGEADSFDTLPAAKESLVTGQARRSA
jgi:hypothetical protein